MHRLLSFFLMLSSATTFGQLPQIGIAAKDLGGELRTFLEIARQSTKNESLFPQLHSIQDRLLKQYKSDSARKIIRNAQDSATNMLLNAALQLYRANRTDLSLKLCAQVIEFRKFSDPTDIRPYDMITLFSVYKGDLNKALFYGLKAVSIQDHGATRKLSERPYDNLGRAYAELGNDELALKYYQKAISVLRRNDTVVYGEILKNTTQCLLRLGRPEQALSVVNENITSRSFNDPYDKAAIREIYGNCYLALGQYDKAENNYLERYKEVAGLHDKVELLIASVPLARLYIKIGEYKKAVFYLTQLDADSTKGWVPVSVQRDVQYMFYNVDSANGSYPAAIAHLKKYKALNDSIFNTARNRQIEELKVQYETAEKEEHIQLLISQGELKNAALQRTLYIRNVSLAGAVVLVLLLLLVYVGYRIKRKNNIVLKKQKEIIRQNNIDLQLLNERQHKLLAEKEGLIKEVHHRVKNNMQIIISLLNAQAEFLENPYALRAITESREIMQAMALIHQRLYLSTESTLIGMRAYIREMVDYLDSGFSSAGNISFQVAVDDIDLDIAQVVPLGLIINEAITNAVKYAFPEDRSGVIRIVLMRAAAGNILMKISDNGIGYRRDTAIEDSNSFGIQLMRMFAEQLEGELSFETDRGVAVSLLFKEQGDIEKYAYSLSRQPMYGENIDR